MLPGKQIVVGKICCWVLLPRDWRRQLSLKCMDYCQRRNCRPRIANRNIAGGGTTDGGIVADYCCRCLGIAAGIIVNHPPIASLLLPCLPYRYLPWLLPQYYLISLLSRLLLHFITAPSHLIIAPTYHLKSLLPGSPRPLFWMSRY